MLIVITAEQSEQCSPVVVKSTTRAVTTIRTTNNDDNNDDDDDDVDDSGDDIGDDGDGDGDGDGDDDDGATSRTHTVRLANRTMKARPRIVITTPPS